MTKYDVAGLLRPADVLLIVPPFAWRDRPSLGVHLLQGVARRAGLEAQVLYAGFLFASFFDEGTHDTVAQMQYGMFLGERLFARAAYGTPSLGIDGGAGMRPTLEALRRAYDRQGVTTTLSLERMLGLEARVMDWLETFTPAIARRSYRVVGCTTSFEQTAGSLAILASVKKFCPATTTILGGANCEGVMAEGILSLNPAVDYVFSGESEATFATFLDHLRAGTKPPERIFDGKPCSTMDELPTPDYADYYAQLDAILPTSTLVTKRQTFLSYETSRGCWWGEKSHCTFCGLNGQGMASREKSPDRVLDELKDLVGRYPTGRVTMTDNIMPHSYFRTVLPRLTNELPGISVLYEEKANLSLKQVRDLVNAGVREIQPGIEALSTGLLRLMAKGTTAAQNVALLRYAQATGLRVQWNLLVGFPNDELSCYEETLALLPLIHHLPPPVSPCPVIIDRFSPYFDHPERYGIRDLRPLPFYSGVLGEGAAIEKLAYHFEGTFRSAGLEHGLVKRIGDAVAGWRTRYYASASVVLRVEREVDGYVLRDTRGLPGLPTSESISESQAAAALVGRPVRRGASANYEWAVERQLAVERDGRFVPLAVASPDLLAEIEQRFRRATDVLRVAV